MDGWVDGETERWMDGWMDGETERLVVDEWAQHMA